MSRQHHAFTRVLSLLLLGLIVYGSTVEAAHTHGKLAAAKAIAGATNFSDPATGTNATTKLTGCGDCLICQLHQNFLATLISVPPSVLSPSLKSHFFDSNPVSVRSETNNHSKAALLHKPSCNSQSRVVAGYAMI